MSAAPWAVAQDAPPPAPEPAPPAPAELPPPKEAKPQEPAPAELPQPEEKKSKETVAPSKVVERWDNREPSPAELPPPGPPLARTETQAFPPMYAQRPLTFPKGMIAPELALHFYRQPLLYENNNVDFGGPSDQVFVEPRIALRVGVTDNLQFDVNAVSFQVSPEVAYTNPEFALTLRFVRGTFDAAFRFRSVLPMLQKTAPAWGFGFPMAFHLGIVRLDTGLHLMAVFDRYGDIKSEAFPPMLGEIRDGQLEAGIPVELNVGLTDYISLGINSGVMFPLPKKPEIGYVPAGFQAGFTVIQSGRPIVDLIARFQLPMIFGIGGDGEGPDKAFFFGFSAKSFFQL